jgi:hypothetical protein
MPHYKIFMRIKKEISQMSGENCGVAVCEIIFQTAENSENG